MDVKIGDQFFMLHGLRSGVVNITHLAKDSAGTLSYLGLCHGTMAFLKDDDLIARDQLVERLKQAIADNKIRLGGSDYMTIWVDAYTFDTGNTWDEGFDEWCKQFKGIRRQAEEDKLIDRLQMDLRMSLHSTDCVITTFHVQVAKTIMEYRSLPNGNLPDMSIYYLLYLWVCIQYMGTGRIMLPHDDMYQENIQQLEDYLLIIPVGKDGEHDLRANGMNLVKSILGMQHEEELPWMERVAQGDQMKLAIHEDVEPLTVRQLFEKTSLPLTPLSVSPPQPRQNSAQSHRPIK